MIKKIIFLFAISCVTSALIGCTEERVYYQEAYQNTQTPPAPNTYSNSVQQMPSSSQGGSTTYYTGVPANPPTSYSSTQTPPAPPSGYATNQTGYYR